jgi:hypothetical protein
MKTIINLVVVGEFDSPHLDRPSRATSVAVIFRRERPIQHKSEALSPPENAFEVNMRKELAIKFDAFEGILTV